MKRILPALAILFSHAATAQVGIPVTKQNWGQSAVVIESQILSEPGYKRISDAQEGPLSSVIYKSTDGTYETLLYFFRRDSLISVTRWLPLPYRNEIAPEANWKPVGLNEWVIDAQNVWIKRVFDGQLIKDVFRRID